MQHAYKNCGIINNTHTTLKKWKLTGDNKINATTEEVIQSSN